MAERAVIELREEAKGAKLPAILKSGKSDERPTEATLTPADPHSPEWAKVVKPITWALLGLLATVMLLPFWFIYWSLPQNVKVVPPPNAQPAQVEAAMRQAVETASAARTKDMLDWSKTVLPSVVGFASAMVGYYFGTRASQGETSKNQPPSPTGSAGGQSGQDGQPRQDAEPGVPPEPE